MSENQKGVLHLDEMLGQKKLKVTWKGGEYELKPYEALTPEEFMEIMALGEKFTGYKNLENTSETSKDILQSVNRMMEIIAPELTELKIPFSGQMLVLSFWKEEQPDPTKKKRAKAS